MYGKRRVSGDRVRRQASGSPSVNSPGAAWVALVCVCTAVFWAGSASARDLFGAAISVGGGPATTFGANKARNVPHWFDATTLQQIDPGYDATQAVAATLDLRGVSGTASYDALATTLRFEVPSAGIDVSFAGGTREEAEAAFQSWLEGDYGDALAPAAATTRLFQALVAESPVDPVAGNPNSLESRMFSADWRLGTGGATPRVGDGGLLPARFRLVVGGGYARADGFDVYAIEVPIHFRFGLGDRLAVLVDLPFAFTSTNGAWSGMGSGGLGLRVAPTSWWRITPAVRVGGVGSVDVGALAALYSGSVTSEMRFPLGPLAIGMGNMGGIAKSIDGIELSGHTIEYELTNPVMRNGLWLEGSLGADALGTGIGWRVGASDVRFFGDDLYMENYQEVTAALAGGLSLLGLQVELAYQVGRRTQGVNARLGLRF